MAPAEDQTATGKQATTADKDSLRELEFDWGEAYNICRDDNGCWQAARRDCVGHLLTARDSGELRAAIRADYELKPVPRDISSVDGES
jgi:hypothetical protein